MTSSADTSVNDAAGFRFDNSWDDVFETDALDDVLRLVGIEDFLCADVSTSGSGADVLTAAEVSAITTEGTWRCLPGSGCSECCSCAPPPEFEDEGLYELVGDVVSAFAAVMGVVRSGQGLTHRRLLCTLSSAGKEEW